MATLIGADALGRAVEKYARRQGVAVATAAAAAGAAVLESGAKRRASRKAGKLANDIDATAPRARGPKVSALVTATDDHAAAEEFGTAHHPAHPYLRPTLHEDSAAVFRAAAAAARAAAGG